MWEFGGWQPFTRLVNYEPLSQTQVGQKLKSFETRASLTCSEILCQETVLMQSLHHMQLVFMFTAYSEGLQLHESNIQTVLLIPWHKILLQVQLALAVDLSSSHK